MNTSQSWFGKCKMAIWSFEELIPNGTFFFISCYTSVTRKRYIKIKDQQRFILEKIALIFPICVWKSYACMKGTNVPYYLVLCQCKIV